MQISTGRGMMNRSMYYNNLPGRRRIWKCSPHLQQRQHRRQLCWVLFVVTMVSSSILPITFTITSAEEQHHRQNESCSKRLERQIDQLQKEIGYCNAVKMAAETRESVIKQQLTDVQQKLQPSSASLKAIAETEQLLQQVSTLTARIKELEQLMDNDKIDGDRIAAEYEQRELESTSACKERNEYLEMRLEEASYFVSLRERWNR
jgi:outer membrane murein-binding lipoprotein Lpp